MQQNPFRFETRANNVFPDTTNAALRLSSAKPEITAEPKTDRSAFANPVAVTSGIST
jgi:hypothetical protein